MTFIGKKCGAAKLFFCGLMLYGINTSAQVTWTKHESNPVLKTGETGSWDSHGAVITSVIHEENVYKAWYIGYDEFENDRIGYAESPDGINWTKNENYPDFPLGDDGAWDEKGIDYVYVLHAEGIYQMWYIGEGWDHYLIGYASSSDGINWEKFAGNPVLELGERGSWDEEELLHPSVVYDGETYHMWYNGYGQSQQRIGYASSPDGITWEKYQNNPVVTLGDDGSWDDNMLGLMGTVYHDNTFHMWYSAGDGAREDFEYIRIGYASSVDGIHWEKNPQNPVLDVGDSGAWDRNGVLTSCVVYEENSGIYKMWYCGIGEKYMTGYATAPALIPTGIDTASQEKPNHFLLRQNFPNPFNYSTSIVYHIQHEGNTTITLYNIAGQKVKTLSDSFHMPGIYRLHVDMSSMPSGQYFYEIKSARFRDTKKMTYLK